MNAAYLQLADSAFPSGAFSQSFGLETAILDGRVHDAAGVAGWIEAYLNGALAPLDGRAMALFLNAAAPLGELDAVLSAALFPAEVRSATRRLARATLEAYLAMGLADPAVTEYRAAIASGAAHGHHALACAIGYRAIGATVADAVRGYTGAAVAALASVAARAIPLGQRDVGALRWSLRGRIDALAAAAAAVRSIDELGSCAVSWEIDAMCHAQLDGRLFAS